MVAKEREGHRFEREILGRASQGTLFLRRDSRDVALHESVKTGEEIKTPVIDLLKSFVRKYLNSSGITGTLIAQNTADTVADAYGADIVFCLELDSEKLFATVDVFFVPDHTLIEMVARRYSDRFGWMDNDEECKRWVVRSILMTQYSQFQDDLYRLKSGLTFEKGEAQFSPTFFDRKSNHFVLTPFDINRGRGLRALGREIALSLARQVGIYGR